MDLERVVGVISQVALLMVWCIVLVLVSRIYLKLRGTAANRSQGEMTGEGIRIKRSFLTFVFGFMPALVVWLPAFGIVPPADPIFMPAVLAWLVLLIFGGLQFYLNLVPTKVALMAGMGIGGAETASMSATAESVSVKEPRRNV